MTGTLLDASGRTIEDSQVAELRSALRGELLDCDHPRYDEARQVWNANIDRRPGLIAECAGAADVVECVNFARDNHLVVAVRGGGHNLAGTSVCDGGLLVDTSRMKAVRVDPRSKTARAQPGLRWGEFDRETTAFGLATTGGTNTDTGIAGLSLGGGMGWLGGKYGMVVDNVLSLDIVTADGKLRTANAGENADLYWACRGGGGNFGVVTEFEYRLYDTGLVLGGMAAYPLPAGPEVLRFYRDFIAGKPDELTTGAGVLHLPDGTPAVGVIVCYNGPIDEGERLIRPLREFGKPLMAEIGPTPYTVMQSMTDEALPPRRQYYAKAPFLKELSDGAIDTVLGHAEKAPSPLSVVLLQQKAGRMSRGGEDTAFGQREAPFNLVIIAGWEEPEMAEINIGWVRQFAEDVQPFSTGGEYFNDLGHQDRESQIRAALGKNYDRLVEVKNRYDPTNLFRHNQNIRPTV